MARIHRMGQKRPVQSFQFIMQASIEEKVLLSLQKKNQLFENLFGKSEDQIELSSTLGQEFLEQAKIWSQPQEPLPTPHFLAPQILLQLPSRFLKHLLAVLRPLKATWHLKQCPNP